MTKNLKISPAEKVSAEEIPDKELRIGNPFFVTKKSLPRKLARAMPSFSLNGSYVGIQRV